MNKNKIDRIDLLPGIEIDSELIPPKRTFKCKIHIRKITKGKPTNSHSKRDILYDQKTNTNR